MREIITLFWLTRNKRYLIVYEIIDRKHEESGRIFVTGYLSVWWHMKWFEYFNPASDIFFVEVSADVYRSV